jgi:phosphoribosylanthranilate isomerase
MRPHIKICCIASVEEARMAQAAGASALGLVSQMPSGPGVLADALIAQIARAMRGQALHTFLLTARTQADAIAAQHAQAGTSTVQLVDHVPPPELQRLRVLLPGVQLVQVIHVLGASAVAEAVACAPWVDAVLLDSGNPTLAVKELGGTGRTHNWAVSRQIRDAIYPLPLWLAGGLRAHNVREAVATVQPFGLDICTGVRVGGALDAAALHAFIEAAHS